MRVLDSASKAKQAGAQSQRRARMHGVSVLGTCANAVSVPGGGELGGPREGEDDGPAGLREAGRSGD